MKIAIFYNLPFGGAKRVVQEHVKGLRKLGHTVDVYTFDHATDIFEPGKSANKEYRYTFSPTVVNVPLIGRLKKDLDHFISLRHLHKKIAQDINVRDYDIVLAHTDFYTQAPFILRFLKTRNVYFCLEPLRIAYEYSLQAPKNLGLLNKGYEIITRYIRKRIDQDNARSAHNTLAISLFGREYMIHAFNLYPKVSYLGIDEKLFHPKKVKKKRQFLFVAEREYIYGYDLVKAAMDLLPKEIRPELKVVFGTKKSQRITDSELINIYNESIATLSVSRFDTFGLIPLESMACGIPVIALNVAGYREIMEDKQTAFLVDFEPEQIAEKMMFFLQNPVIAQSMGEKGLEWVKKNWTWTKQIKQLEQLLIGFSASK